MRLFLAVVALAASLVLADRAAAAPTWLSPVTLSPQSPGEVQGAEIASDDAGHVAAVWMKQTGMAPLEYRTQLSLRSPGGGFTPAVNLSSASDQYTEPDVGVDGGGTATVAWSETTGATSSIKVARIDAAGSRSGDQTLSSAGRDPRIAVAVNGAAVVTWKEGNAIHAATRADGGSAFINAGAISATGMLEIDHAVEMDAAGNAIAAWVRGGAVETNPRPAGAGFLGVQPIPGGGTARALHLAMAPNGRATAIWELASLPSLVRSSERTITPDFANGGWSAAELASQPGVPSSSPSVALDAENTAIAIWQATVGSGQVVQGAERPSGGSFQDYRPLSNAAASGFSARVDVAPDGAAVAIWSGVSGGQPAIQATRRGPGLAGEFGAVTDITVGAAAPADPTVDLFSPAVAVDGEGNAAAVWSRFRQSAPLSINDWAVEAAGFDAAPPSLSAVSVPTSASINTAVGMAAAATDRWTPVSFSWSFGDDTGAPGDAVTHAFGTAGTYGVTVTATDGVGNAASAARQILISGPEITQRIDATVQTKWAHDAATGKKFVLLRLKVVKPPEGTAVQLRCAGKKCPYRSKRATKFRKGDITMFKLRSPAKAAKSKDRRFRAGQRVQIRVTKPGYIGKVVKFKLKRRKDPVGKVRCLPLGASKPRKTC